MAVLIGPPLLYAAAVAAPTRLAVCHIACVGFITSYKTCPKKNKNKNTRIQDKTFFGFILPQANKRYFCKAGLTKLGEIAKNVNATK